MTLAQMNEALTAIIGAVTLAAVLPCRRVSERTTCLRAAHALKSDKAGKPRFWYGSDCPYPAAHFCDACLAYWHLACARNIIIAAGRHGG